PSSRIAASTSSRVCRLTLGWSLSTRDTVWCETPASLATSAMTGRAVCPFAADATQRPPSRLIANPREQHHEVTRLLTLTYLRVKSCARLIPRVSEIVRAKHPGTIRKSPTCVERDRDPFSRPVSAEDLAAQTALLEQAAADSEANLGPQHPDTLAARGALARAYLFWGRSAEATALHEKNLPLYEEVLGPEHAAALIARNDLAVAYRSVGRGADAIALHEQTLAVQERLHGPDDPATMATRSNLATAYWSAGRPTAALTSFEQTLASQERVLGIGHPQTMHTRSNLAIAYLADGRIAEAIAKHEQNLAVRERKLGPDDP